MVLSYRSKVQSTHSQYLDEHTLYIVYIDCITKKGGENRTKKVRWGWGFGIKCTLKEIRQKNRKF